MGAQPFGDTAAGVLQMVAPNGGVYASLNTNGDIIGATIITPATLHITCSYGLYCSGSNGINIRTLASPAQIISSTGAIAGTSITGSFLNINNIGSIGI